jgi:hypothetical protein
MEPRPFASQSTQRTLGLGVAGVLVAAALSAGAPGCGSGGTTATGGGGHTTSASSTTGTGGASTSSSTTGTSSSTGGATASSSSTGGAGTTTVSSSTTGTGGATSSSSTTGSGGAGGSAPGGSVLWTRTFSMTVPPPGGFGVTPDGEINAHTPGHIILAGWFSGTVAFGSLVEAGGSGEGLILDLDDTGNPVWVDTPPSEVDWLGGNGMGSFTGSTYPPVGQVAASLLVFDQTGGMTWSKTYGGASGGFETRATAADAAGNVYLEGQVTSGTVDLGDGTMSPVGWYLTKLDPTGAFTWSQPWEYLFGGLDAAGDTLAFTNDVGGNDFGCGPATASFAKFGPQGQCLWAQPIDVAATGLYLMNMNAAGESMLTVNPFVGTVDFGCGAVTAASDSLLLARYDASGNCVWSHVLPGTDYVAEGSLLPEPTGTSDWILQLGYGGVLDFGAGPMGPGSPGTFVTFKVDAAGNLKWYANQAFATISGDPAGGAVGLTYVKGALGFDEYSVTRFAP